MVPVSRKKARHPPWESRAWGRWWAGLPVHIAAKILGHTNLNTTQGYIAVYDHDVIEHQHNDRQAR
jgi:integrase